MYSSGAHIVYDIVSDPFYVLPFARSLFLCQALTIGVVNVVGSSIAREWGDQVPWERRCDRGMKLPNKRVGGAFIYFFQLLKWLSRGINIVGKALNYQSQCSSTVKQNWRFTRREYHSQCFRKWDFQVPIWRFTKFQGRMPACTCMLDLRLEWPQPKHLLARLLFWFREWGS